MLRMGVERRKHARLKVRVAVGLRPEGYEEWIRVETADLSLGGCYVEILLTLEVGTQLDMTLQLGDSTLLARGEVVTCDRTVGNGIRFTRMMSDDREKFDYFLRAVEREQKANVVPAEDATRKTG